jgi:hypothetical protein
MQPPNLVFLFSGHMIDSAERARQGNHRFPPQCELQVAQAIDAKLGELGAGANDLGITQGACGGDLLFAEGLLRRGASLQLLLPMEEDTFLQKSVVFAKAPADEPDRWRDRFLSVREHPRVQTTVMPDAREPHEPEDVFARCNLRMLDLATSFGAHKLRFLCLWNGQRGDGPGGTQHMRDAVKERGGSEYWLDIRTLCI